ncbi:MAG: pyridoxal-phosphate dependent enzyme, partial [Rhodospirillaceae bacterium]|nr:pyridoxal-phosphate dependent enzyme [Rhodospirillales bacterium]
MEDLIRELLERWRGDAGGTYRSWFLWDERLKNFRSIRRGVAQVVAEIEAGTFGNFGQAIAAAAKAMSIPAVIHVPDHAARVKVEALRRLGAEVREHSFADWWAIMQSRETGDRGQFFHPVCEREVIAGAATIGEELCEDLDGIETVLVPIGGGGLACGIAQAVKRR